MRKDDVRKVKKAAELIAKCKKEIQRIPLSGESANQVFRIICNHRSSFYHIFYDQPTHIDPLFMYLMPIDQMEYFIALLDIMSSATFASSCNGGIIQSSHRELSVQNITSLLDDFEKILWISFRSKSNMVFYSWQNALPNICRNFIEDALKKSIKEVGKCYEYPLQLDKDTKERSGSPEIAQVIFEKIDMSMAFVADVSTIDSTVLKRKVPNPNVMIELGYALNVLGEENIILVMNKISGSIEDLPFDLRGKRILTYECSEKMSCDERKIVKKSLVKDLTNALKLICKNNQI